MTEKTTTSRKKDFDQLAKALKENMKRRRVRKKQQENGKSDENVN